jgi:SAM-dependent methyltransferase
MAKQADPEAYRYTAEFYDHLLPYRERPDVAFYIAAAREWGGPVLEVGCGTGRVLIPTARAGITITGLDLSAAMLDICRRRLAEEPQGVREQTRLVTADMRDFDLGQTFTLVTLPFRPFQHLLTVGDQIACLQAVHRHLAPGGHLILDIFNPSMKALTERAIGEEFGAEPLVTMPDGRQVIRRHRIVEHDLYHQINHVELIYYVTHVDGREERLVHAFPMRYLFRYEAEHLLARAGFIVEALYADYERRPYGAEYPGELIFVARKAPGATGD